MSVVIQFLFLRQKFRRCSTDTRSGRRGPVSVVVSLAIMSSQTRQTRLVVFGVALHALLIYAMFDVHFLTPLVHDIEPTKADFAAPV